VDNGFGEVHLSQDLAAPVRMRAGVPIILAIGDVLVAQSCVLAALVLRQYLATWLPISLGPSAFFGINLSVLALPLGFLAVGLYPGYGLQPAQRLRLRTLVVVSGFGLMSLFDYVALNGQWSRGILLIAATFALISLPLWDMLACSVLIRLGVWGEEVVVFGATPQRQAVVRSLLENPALGWRPTVAASWPPTGMAKDGIDLAILIPPHDGPSLHEIADRLPYQRIVIIPDLGNIQTQWVAARDTGFGLGLELRRNLLKPLNQVIKRAVDLLISLALVPLALPVIALFALLVMACSPGLPFYGQMRVGRNGKGFRVWKIRSMVRDADERLQALLERDSDIRRQWQAHMKLKSDPRVIPLLGHLMRRFSIDELPQLFNVLTGDMSLIGPRPLPDYHLRVIPVELAELRARVRPGITGLSQVSGRSARSVAEQAQLDAYYIRNWSLWIDLHVLMLTMVEVISGRGAH
jgi:exopolysaccharide biosynthesis polyprenyl glycosylphosphotransferase